jgi:hypothetical protein
MFTKPGCLMNRAEDAGGEKRHNALFVASMA